MLVLQKLELPTVFGIAITAYDRNAAIRQIVALAKARRPAFAFTMTVDQAIQLRGDRRLRAACATADVVAADGWPAAWLARRQHSAVESTAGAGLLLALVHQAANTALPIYLLGASPGIIQRAGEALVDHTAGLIDISGSHAPAQNFDPTGAEADDAIERIRRSGAALCFVGGTAPNPHLLAAHARERGLRCCIVCVGAAFDRLAGKKAQIQ